MVRAERESCEGGGQSRESHVREVVRAERESCEGRWSESHVRGGGQRESHVRGGGQRVM